MTRNLFNAVAAPMSEGDLLCWPQAIRVGVELTPEEERKLRRMERSTRLLAFRDFALGHPHECHDKWPWRFWIVFHYMLPYVSREQMRKTLKETE